MKKVHMDKKNHGMLPSYSALAAAFLAAGTAYTQVIYHDIDDITIEQGDTLSLDLDGDGTRDFIFRVGEFSITGSWTYGLMFGDITYLGIGGPSNKAICVTSAYYYNAVALDYGQTIGSTGNFAGSAASYNDAVLAADFFGTYYGYFGNAGDKYIGVQFKIGTGLHYGWIRVNVSVHPITITLKDYAYDGTPDMPIVAGDTVGPETGIAESDNGIISAYSSGKSIQLIMQEGYSRHADLRVLNMAGQNVYAGEAEAGHTSIDLGDVPGGEYLLEVISDTKIWTKKLFLGK